MAGDPQRATPATLWASPNPSVWGAPGSLATSVLAVRLRARSLATLVIRSASRTASGTLNANVSGLCRSLSRNWRRDRCAGDHRISASTESSRELVASEVSAGAVSQASCIGIRLQQES